MVSALVNYNYFTCYYLQFLTEIATKTVTSFTDFFCFNPILPGWGRGGGRAHCADFKGEGHSRNGVCFEIANKKITLS